MNRSIKTRVALRGNSAQRQHNSGAARDHNRSGPQSRLSDGRITRMKAAVIPTPADAAAVAQAPGPRIFSVSGRRHRCGSSSSSSGASADNHAQSQKQQPQNSTEEDPEVIAVTSSAEKEAHNVLSELMASSVEALKDALEVTLPPSGEAECDTAAGGWGGSSPLQVPVPESQRRGSYPRTVDDLHVVIDRVQRSCGNALQEEEEIERLSVQHNIPLNGPWMQRGRATYRSPHLNSLAADVLVKIMSFCDLHSLGRLTRINSRFFALCTCHELWMAHAAARNIPVKYHVSAKEQLKEGLQKQRQMNDAEVESCEAVLKDLEKRMAARVQANYEQAVDVEATLAAHDPSAILRGNYKKWNPAPSGYSCAGGAEQNTQHATKRDTQLRELAEKVQALEKIRQQLMSAAAFNKQSIAGQQRQLDILQGRIIHSHLPPAEEANTAALSGSYVSYGDLLAFERRMVRIVLCGPRSTNPTAAEMPVVLTRGIQDFGTLELLTMQPQAENVPWRIKPVQDRWAAFKKFLPLNDDFYTVRSIVGDLATRCTEDEGAAAAPLALNKRSEQALLRVSGLVRRLLAMRDQEVIDVTM